MKYRGFFLSRATSRCHSRSVRIFHVSVASSSSSSLMRTTSSSLYDSPQQQGQQQRRMIHTDASKSSSSPSLNTDSMPTTSTPTNDGGESDRTRSSEFYSPSAPQKPRGMSSLNWETLLIRSGAKQRIDEGRHTHADTQAHRHTRNRLEAQRQRARRARQGRPFASATATAGEEGDGQRNAKGEIEDDVLMIYPGAELPPIKPQKATRFSFLGDPSQRSAPDYTTNYIVPNNTPKPLLPMWASSLTSPTLSKQRIVEDNWIHMHGGVGGELEANRVDSFLKWVKERMSYQSTSTTTKGSSQSTEVQSSIFIDMLASNVDTQPRALYTRGLYAKRDFKENETILVVPLEAPQGLNLQEKEKESEVWGMLLNSETMRKHSVAAQRRAVPSFNTVAQVLGRRKSSFDHIPHPLFIDQMHFALYLACERAEGEASPLFPYLSLLAPFDDAYVNELHLGVLDPPTHLELQDQKRKFDHYLREILKIWNEQYERSTLARPKEEEEKEKEKGKEPVNSSSASESSSFSQGAATQKMMMMISAAGEENSFEMRDPNLIKPKPYSSADEPLDMNGMNASSSPSEDLKSDAYTNSTSPSIESVSVSDTGDTESFSSSSPLLPPPTFEELEWAFRVVLSRQKMFAGLREYQEPFVEESKSKEQVQKLDPFARTVMKLQRLFYEKVLRAAEPDGFERNDFDPSSIACVIPFVDMLQHDPSGQGNVTYSLETLTMSTPSSASSASASSLSERNSKAEEKSPHDSSSFPAIVIRAAEDIEDGDELTTCFTRCYSLAYTLYRFGFLPLRPREVDARELMETAMRMNTSSSEKLEYGKEGNAALEETLSFRKREPIPNKQSSIKRSVQFNCDNTMSDPSTVGPTVGGSGSDFHRGGASASNERNAASETRSEGLLIGGGVRRVRVGGGAAPVRLDSSLQQQAAGSAANTSSNSSASSPFRPSSISCASTTTNTTTTTAVSSPNGATARSAAALQSSGEGSRLHTTRGGGATPSLTAKAEPSCLSTSLGEGNRSSNSNSQPSQAPVAVAGGQVQPLTVGELSSAQAGSGSVVPATVSSSRRTSSRPISFISSALPSGASSPSYSTYITKSPRTSGGSGAGKALNISSTMDGSEGAMGPASSATAAAGPVSGITANDASKNGTGEESQERAIHSPPEALQNRKRLSSSSSSSFSVCKLCNQRVAVADIADHCFTCPMLPHNVAAAQKRVGAFVEAKLHQLDEATMFEYGSSDGEGEDENENSENVVRRAAVSGGAGMTRISEGTGVKENSAQQQRAPSKYMRPPRVMHAGGSGSSNNGSSSREMRGGVPTTTTGTATTTTVTGMEQEQEIEEEKEEGGGPCIQQVESRTVGNVSARVGGGRVSQRAEDTHTSSAPRRPSPMSSNKKVSSGATTATTPGVGERTFHKSTKAFMRDIEKSTEQSKRAGSNTNTGGGRAAGSTVRPSSATRAAGIGGAGGAATAGSAPLSTSRRSTPDRRPSPLLRPSIGHRPDQAQWKKLYSALYTPLNLVNSSGGGGAGGAGSRAASNDSRYADPTAPTPAAAARAASPIVGNATRTATNHASRSGQPTAHRRGPIPSPLSHTPRPVVTTHSATTTGTLNSSPSTTPAAATTTATTTTAAAASHSASVGNRTAQIGQPKQQQQQQQVATPRVSSKALPTSPIKSSSHKGASGLKSSSTGAVSRPKVGLGEKVKEKTVSNPSQSSLSAATQAKKSHDSFSQGDSVAVVAAVAAASSQCNSQLRLERHGVNEEEEGEGETKENPAAESHSRSSSASMLSSTLPTRGDGGGGDTLGAERRGTRAPRLSEIDMVCAAADDVQSSQQQQQNQQVPSTLSRTPTTSTTTTTTPQSKQWNETTTSSSGTSSSSSPKKTTHLPRDRCENEKGNKETVEKDDTILTNTTTATFPMGTHEVSRAEVGCSGEGDGDTSFNRNSTKHVTTKRVKPAARAASASKSSSSAIRTTSPIAPIRKKSPATAAAVSSTSTTRASTGTPATTARNFTSVPSTRQTTIMRSGLSRTSSKDRNAKPLGSHNDSSVHSQRSSSQGSTRSARRVAINKKVKDSNKMDEYHENHDDDADVVLENGGKGEGNRTSRKVHVASGATRGSSSASKPRLAGGKKRSTTADRDTSSQFSRGSSRPPDSELRRRDSVYSNRSNKENHNMKRRSSGSAPNTRTGGTADDSINEGVAPVSGRRTLSVPKRSKGTRCCSPYRGGVVPLDSVPSGGGGAGVGNVSGVDAGNTSIDNGAVGPATTRRRATPQGIRPSRSKAPGNNADASALSRPSTPQPLSHQQQQQTDRAVTSRRESPQTQRRGSQPQRGVTPRAKHASTRLRTFDELKDVWVPSASRPVSMSTVVGGTGAGAAGAHNENRYACLEYDGGVGGCYNDDENDDVAVSMDEDQVQVNFYASSTHPAENDYENRMDSMERGSDVNKNHIDSNYPAMSIPSAATTGNTTHLTVRRIPVSGVNEPTAAAAAAAEGGLDYTSPEKAPHPHPYRNSLEEDKVRERRQFGSGSSLLGNSSSNSHNQQQQQQGARPRPPPKSSSQWAAEVLGLNYRRDLDDDDDDEDENNSEDKNHHHYHDTQGVYRQYNHSQGSTNAQHHRYGSAGENDDDPTESEPEVSPPLQRSVVGPHTRASTIEPGRETSCGTAATNTSIITTTTTATMSASEVKSKSPSADRRVVPMMTLMDKDSGVSAPPPHFHLSAASAGSSIGTSSNAPRGAQSSSLSSSSSPAAVQQRKTLPMHLLGSSRKSSTSSNANGMNSTGKPSAPSDANSPSKSNNPTTSTTSYIGKQQPSSSSRTESPHDHAVRLARVRRAAREEALMRGENNEEEMREERGEGTSFP